MRTRTPLGLIMLTPTKKDRQCRGNLYGVLNRSSSDCEVTSGHAVSSKSVSLRVQGNQPGAGTSFSLELECSSCLWVGLSLC